MSKPTNWPLPENSVRYLVPKTAIDEMEINILSRGLYPLSYGHYQQAKSHSARRPKHSEHLIIFCTQGTGHLITEKQRTTIKPGDVIYLPEGLSHHYYSDDKDPWSIYWAHINGHLFKQFMDSCGLDETQLIINMPKKALLQYEFQELVETRLHSHDFNSFLYASNILKKILAAIAHYAGRSKRLQNKGKDIQTLMDYMQDNIDRSISLQDFADLLDVSKFHLVRMFQQQMGISPVRYFLELKVKHACMLLDRSNDPIKNIAEELGYDDPYYFSRLFKKVMGISPKQYRLTQHGH